MIVARNTLWKVACKNAAQSARKKSTGVNRWNVTTKKEETNNAKNALKTA